MKKLLFIIPLLFMSCDKEANNKVNLEKQITENAKTYMLANFGETEKITVDRLDLIKIDTITPKAEMYYTLDIYDSKMDSLLSDSKQHSAQANKYSILENVVAESNVAVKKNGILMRDYKNKMDNIYENRKKADSTTILGYTALFNVKITRDKTMEGFNMDSVPLNFYKDMTIMNPKDYTKKLLKKY